MIEAALKIANDRGESICEALNQSLADTVAATMLAQNYHWNVTGMHFMPLHTLFQDIYEDHFAAQDELAERIKAVGGHAEATLSSIVARTSVREHSGRANDVVMVEHMADTQDALAATLSASASRAAKLGDPLTEDLCIGRGRQHEKFAWMLRSHLRD